MKPYLRIGFAKKFLLPLWYDEKEDKFTFTIIGDRFYELYGRTFNFHGEKQPVFFSNPEIARVFLVQSQQQKEAKRKVSYQPSYYVSLTNFGLELLQEVRRPEIPENQQAEEDFIQSQISPVLLVLHNREKREKKRAAKESKIPLSYRRNKKPRLHICDLPKTIITPEVFEKLEPLDLSSASRVCKQWRDFSDVHLWKPQLVKRWQFSFMSRDLPLSTPLVLVDGFTSYREACNSQKTRLYFGQNNGQPQILVHQKPLNQSWGQ